MCNIAKKITVLTTKIVLPADFESQMQADLGDEFFDFQQALAQAPPVSIRRNNKKNNFQNTDTEQVKWCSDGFYLPQRPIFTLDPALHAGAYYVQEAASMFVAEAVRQTVDLTSPRAVLDFCAAPGGKTTLLGNLLSDDSLLVANEVIKSRVEVLKENVTKFGNFNTIISHHEVEDFEKLVGFFDLVLIDAPCSGEGLFRKDADAMQEWSPDAVQHCAARQRRILAEASHLVKKNGVLAYSTCTYNATENENNIAWLLQQADFEEITLHIPTDWNIVKKKYGYQFYPHRTRGEGFFLAALRKKDGDEEFIFPKNLSFSSLQKLATRQAEQVSRFLENPLQFSFFVKPNEEIVILATSQIKNLQFIDSFLRRKSLGVTVGSFKGQDFVPTHDLALSQAVRKNLPAVELDKRQALLFLKKEEIVLPSDAPRGWLLARYEGLNLGWLKNLGNRSNNYLPKEYRIRMNLGNTVE